MVLNQVRDTMRDDERLVADGACQQLRRGDPGFEGAVVHLGALGVVTTVTLDIQAPYRVSQYVFEGLGWQTLFDHFESVLGAAYSVSVFTRLQEDPAEGVDMVWVKSRTDGAASPEGDLLGARVAVLRGSRLDDVRDEDVVAGQPGLRQELVEELARRADERAPGGVLLRARGLADARTGGVRMCDELLARASGPQGYDAVGAIAALGRSEGRKSRWRTIALWVIAAIFIGILIAIKQL